MTEPEPTDDNPVPQTFLAEVRDAISTRTFLLVLGVLFLQLAFILSYVGAFHAPKPHRIPVAVVAPAPVASQFVAGLNGVPSSPLHATVAASEAVALADIHQAKTSAALVVDSTGKADRLLVASGGGSSVVTAVEAVVGQVEAAQRRTVTTSDVVPLQSGDGRGLTGFYVVIGWIVGGYLVAALLGVAKGARPATFQRAAIRLLSMVPYAVVSGLGGALVVDQLLGALTGHLLALWGLGALLVLAAATVTMALEVLFGVLGIGITVLFFVVLGNPSAGGAYQPSLLPPFWRAISGALPNGAGTDAVRRIAYFGGHGVGLPILVIALYAAVGTAVALVASRTRRPVSS